MKHLILLLFSGVLYAEPVKVTQLSLETTKIINKRHYFFPEYDVKDQWTSGLMLRWNISFLDDRLYWNNSTYFDADHQVRHIGWQYEQGINLFNSQIQLMYQHHSQHGAEYKHPDNIRYPLDDRYGVRFNFILDK